MEDIRRFNRGVCCHKLHVGPRRQTEGPAFLAPLFLIIPVGPSVWLRATWGLLCGSGAHASSPALPWAAFPAPTPSHMNMTLLVSTDREQLPPAETSDPKATREFGFWILARRPVAHQVSMNKDFFLPLKLIAIRLFVVIIITINISNWWCFPLWE